MSDSTEARGAGRWRVLLVFAALALASGVEAQELVPSEKVTSRVIVRDAPSRRGADVGSLRPGERARLLEAGDDWHHVKLEGGRDGFVSAAWTVLVPTAWDVSARPPAGVYAKHAERFEFRPEATLAATRVTPPRPQPTGLSGLFRRIVSVFRPPEEVTLDLSSPTLGESTRQHYDPRLPVAGLARTSGSSGSFDVVIVIDVSASTNEFTEADVDGDGRAQDEWKGADSILEAQTRAAAEFVRAVERLPGNRDGRRIRVGLVAFSGDDALLLDPTDRELALDEADLRILAERDATLELGLSRDYRAALGALETLAARGGAGMTDFAAGLTRATLALVEAPLDAQAAEDRPERVIYFLTDGKPRLPHDREKAERAARRAAAFAARQRVRVHTFALGHDAVTGRLDETVQQVARATGGTCTELENPADIVPLLRATAISFVDRVKIVNRTSGEETDYVTTGIDGSFYGEIPLVEGANEIDLVAVLYGGKQHTERLRVDFEAVPREQRMAEELDEIRQENAVLIEEIKEKLREKLAQRIEEQRRRARPPEQGKELEITLPASAARR
jgi:hypothetical protein